MFGIHSWLKSQTHIPAETDKARDLIRKHHNPGMLCLLRMLVWQTDRFVKSCATESTEVEDKEVMGRREK